MAFEPNVNWVNDAPPGFEADEMIRMQLGIADAASAAADAQHVAAQAAADIGQKVDKGELVINVLDFGAVGDLATDNRAALQAAIDHAIDTSRPIYIPAGGYRVDGTLTAATGITVTGDGPKQSVIYGHSGDLLHISGGNHHWENLKLHGRNSAGNTVVLPPGQSLGLSRFSKVDFGNGNDASHVWVYDSPVAGSGGGMFDVHWIDCTFTHRTTGTVNPFYVRGGQCFAANRFTRCRYHSSGKHFVNIEVVQPSAYVYSNVWDTINFEVCNYGGIRLTSALNFGMFNLAFFDNGDIHDDLIVIDRMPADGGPYKAQSRGNIISNYHRSGGTLVGDAVDVDLVSGGVIGTVIDNADGPTAAGLVIDLHDTPATLRVTNTSSPTVLNPRRATVLGADRGVATPNLAHTDSTGTVGFYGATPITRPSVPGAGTVTADDLRAALISLGLIS